jgi:hypothetical protein
VSDDVDHSFPLDWKAYPDGVFPVDPDKTYTLCVTLTGGACVRLLDEVTFRWIAGINAKFGDAIEIGHEVAFTPKCSSVRLEQRLHQDGARIGDVSIRPPWELYSGQVDPTKLIAEKRYEFSADLVAGAGARLVGIESGEILALVVATEAQGLLHKTCFANPLINEAVRVEIALPHASRSSVSAVAIKLAS